MHSFFRFCGGRKPFGGVVEEQKGLVLLKTMKAAHKLNAFLRSGNQVALAASKPSTYFKKEQGLKHK